jgi:archaellum component FlaF (FlaF/FlaG flagellin family)
MNFDINSSWFAVFVGYVVGDIIMYLKTKREYEKVIAEKNQQIDQLIELCNESIVIYNKIFEKLGLK